jgi:hypothetical protein
MGYGETITLGYVNENGKWVAVSEDNPLPVQSEESA